MIYVDRNRYDKPRYFYSKDYEEKLKELNDFYKSSKSKRAQQRFNKYALPSYLKSNLSELFNGKCAYCETKIQLDSNYNKSYSYLDHFRPRNNAKGFHVRETDLEHYWWLMYEWENLYFCCLECNKYKSSWFPVDGKRAKPETPHKYILSKEQNLILDPCHNRIEDHLGFKISGVLVPKDKIGETTIEVLHLNRPNLVENRAVSLRTESKNWDKVSSTFWESSKLKNEGVISQWILLFNGRSKVEHAGIRQLFLIERFNQHPEIFDAFNRIRSKNDSSKTTIPFVELSAEKSNESLPEDEGSSIQLLSDEISSIQSMVSEPLKPINEFKNIENITNEIEQLKRVQDITSNIKQIQPLKQIDSLTNQIKSIENTINNTNEIESLGTIKHITNNIKKLKVIQDFSVPYKPIARIQKLTRQMDIIKSKQGKRESNKKNSPLVTFDVNTNVLSRKKTKVRIRELLKNIYISKIELKNYKCFDSITIDLTKEMKGENEPWLVFLGENGVGKSSLIKAVAFALMGQVYLDSLGLDVNKILKYRKRKGYIRVHGTKKGEVYEVTFAKNDTLKSNIKKPPCFLLGYGSTRLLPKGNVLKPEENTSYVKARNLFDYSVALCDAKNWLLEIPKSLFDEVAKSLKDILLLDNKDLIKRERRNKRLYIYFTDQKSRIDVEELSDGYRSIFAITVDIIKTLSKDVKAFDASEAIVLIDEIGTHLHPRWKMAVVERLRRTFPKIQFIATTHEPLCLRGLSKNEVIVLKKSNEGDILSINDLPDPSEFRVDQLLTSEYFGLSSTLDAETEQNFSEYYHLLAIESAHRTKEEQDRVIELEKLLPYKKHLGEDIRDELVYYVIDELLAKQIKQNGFKSANDNIKQQALDRVQEMWQFIDGVE